MLQRNYYYCGIWFQEEITRVCNKIFLLLLLVFMYCLLLNSKMKPTFFYHVGFISKQKIYFRKSKLNTKKLWNLYWILYLLPFLSIHKWFTSMLTFHPLWYRFDFCYIFRIVPVDESTEIFWKVVIVRSGKKCILGSCYTRNSYISSNMVL